MIVLPVIFPLSFSLSIQFLLWFNLLFPYNSLFENLNRNSYLVFSITGFFIACISIVFYRILALERESKKLFIIAAVLQILSLLSCVFFAFSSLTGWLVLV